MPDVDLDELSQYSFLRRLRSGQPDEFDLDVRLTGVLAQPVGNAPESPRRPPITDAVTCPPDDCVRNTVNDCPDSGIAKSQTFVVPICLRKKPTVAEAPTRLVQNFVKAHVRMWREIHRVALPPFLDFTGLGAIVEMVPF